MPNRDHTSTSYYQNGNSIVDLGDAICTLEFLDFACRLKAYDENLEIACVDPDLAGLDDAPFILLERCNDGKMRKIFGFWEPNDSVFERLSLADSDRINILGYIDKKTAEAEQSEYRRYRDKQEENAALVEAVVRNNKSRYTYVEESSGDKVTIFEDRPSKREAPKEY